MEKLNKKILAEIMFVLLTGTIFYQLSDNKEIPMFLFWNIFAYMVTEDYKNQTVDLSCVILLILFGGSAAESQKIFLMSLAAGMVIFRIMYLATTRIYEKKEFNEAKKCRRTKRGYLPSLGVGTLLFLIFEKNLVLETECLRETMEFIMEIREVAAITMGMILILWGILEYRLREAKRMNKEIVYGLGGGDVLVLGVFFGIFGAEKMYFVFLISLLVQLIEFLAANKVIKGGEKI